MKTPDTFPRAALFSRVHFGQRRRGAVMIIALICLLMATVMVTSLARTAVLERERVIRDEWQLQAEWLAESALDRAVLRSGDPEYDGETWRPTVADAAEPLGTVKISITRTEGEPATITVVADVPDDATERVRVRRELILTQSELSNSESAP